MDISLSRAPYYACSSHSHLLSQALLVSPEGHALQMWACPRHQCSLRGHLSLLQRSEYRSEIQRPLPVQLSLARKQEGAAPTCCKLRHTGSSITTTSSLTTSSSLYTSSMSSTDTVLHKDPAALPSYELQSRAVCASTPQQMPMPRR